MAYAEFNDMDVNEFVYPKYGNPDDPLANRYPEQVRIKYPKTGTTNPSIKINVFEDLTSDAPTSLNVQAPTDLGRLLTIRLFNSMGIRRNVFAFLLYAVYNTSHFIVEGYIYTAITWINEETVSVIWMNRVQNQSEVTECRKNTLKVRKIN